MYLDEEKREEERHTRSDGDTYVSFVLLDVGQRRTSHAYVLSYVHSLSFPFFVVPSLLFLSFYSIDVHIHHVYPFGSGTKCRSNPSGKIRTGTYRLFTSLVRLFPSPTRKRVW